MKKVFSLLIIAFVAVTCLVGCGGGATPISGKTFSVESMTAGETDISAGYKDNVTYKYYDSTFIFEMNAGQDSYTYFIGNYEYDEGNITIEITKSVGSVASTTDLALSTFKTTSLEYKDNKLTIQATHGDVVYSYVLAE